MQDVVAEDVESNTNTGTSIILAGLLIPHAVCTLFIAARVWSRWGLLRLWFWDDSLMLAAWLFSTAICVVYSIAAAMPGLTEMVMLTVASAAGTLNGLRPDELHAVESYMLRTYLGLIFYQMCLCLTKLSILAFYLRMFYPRPLERRLAQGTLAFVLIYGIPLLIMSIFQCHPVTGTFFGQNMRCLPFEPLLISSASLHTATDVWLIVMIIPCIVRLELPRRQKVALTVVLSLSIFVVAASLARLQLSLHGNYRPSGVGVRVKNTLAFFVMTMLECDMALICASAPTLRPLIARFLPRVGLGEPVPPTWRRRSGNQSLNLTVVSYNGYPWTEPVTPVNRSKTDVGAATTPWPVPPIPGVVHRTPTSLSLRSIITNIAPRSRANTLTGRGGDRTVLLKDDEKDKRRSSLFDGYYEPHDVYVEEISEAGGSQSSGQENGSNNRWASSQESFVMGLNDPASPKLGPEGGLRHSIETRTSEEKGVREEGSKGKNIAGTEGQADVLQEKKETESIGRA